MTQRLYLADPYATQFSARVVSTADLDGKPATILDRSAFYPEGGGQPGDRGLLGEIPVLDTQDRDGQVLHLLERPLTAKIGDTLEGKVDWLRRFDHMQQHHGQHLLSAAFVHVLQANTVSFHLGERLCTIDLECSISKLDEKSLRSVEAEVNRTIWRNLPVVARDFVGEERDRLSLRKEAVKGNRVVVVEGVDASPCGGTHPSHTAEVGSVAVLRAQKWGSGQARVEFVCGGRVVRELASATQSLAGVAEALKCSPAEVVEATQRTAAEAQSRRKSLDALSTEHGQLLAEQLAAKSAPGPVVANVERGALMARTVASALARLGRIAFIASVDEGRAYLCFARPAGTGISMNDLLREAVSTLKGKGGGSAELAQGSGQPEGLAAVLEQAALRAKG
jgi:alanyl-tRNA synthetase